MARLFRSLGIPQSNGSLLSVVGLVVLVACGNTATGLDEIREIVRMNPLTELRLFVDPDARAIHQAAAWAADRPADAEALEHIAEQPQADWFGDWNDDIESAVAERVRQIRAAGATPLLVAYNIPLRDCGQYSAGGASSADDYRAWISDFARGLGEGSAIVILEPDAAAGVDCLEPAQREERFALLSDAVSTLKRRPGTVVYVDAGHPLWLSAGETARRLRKAGIESADGFALNVSNTIESEMNIRYGRDISDALDGKHFVIDTSRNGVGSPEDGEWCNPPGRALGPDPTVDTGEERVDAFFWIKRPGESDGECNGGPRAGAWWAEYALELARNADMTA